MMAAMLKGRLLSALQPISSHNTIENVETSLANNIER